jgi:hypothetical protein
MTDAVRSALQAVWDDWKAATQAADPDSFDYNIKDVRPETVAQVKEALSASAGGVTRTLVSKKAAVKIVNDKITEMLDRDAHPVVITSLEKVRDSISALSPGYCGGAAMMILIALIATANAIWAVTGEPVSRPCAALAGFVCGTSWFAVYVKGGVL